MPCRFVSGYKEGKENPMQLKITLNLSKENIAGEAPTRKCSCKNGS
jgi:hypothetical protein